MTNLYKGTIEVLNPSVKVADTKVKLNCGINMPVIGFGTYTIRGPRIIHNAIDAALAAGYRSFDTASSYGNEEDIGVALKELLPKYNLKRTDIFVTSKLAPKDQGSDLVYDAVVRSLNHLGFSYLDLYLIHWPGVHGVDISSKENKKLRKESWKGLEDLYKAGKLKAIGVSNYTARHFQEVLAHATVRPAVNQVEYHIYYRHPEDLYKICSESGTLLQAYSSLGGNGIKDVLADATVKKIADELSVQPAQILLRWSLQTGFGVIPKSVNPERIKSNIDLDFLLSDEQLKALNSIQHRQKFSWNPDTIV
uniref:Putative aldo-keto reductase n=1 Tax=Panstrongylus megistus TaxID=65343 RepID=A0A069DSG9_9HEMI